MYFVLLYDLVDDYLERRAPLREQHLKLAREAEARGELVLGGALADPADRSIIVFKGDDASVAERFAKADPYVHNGLVKKWTVRKWSLVVGSYLPK
ncbi:MAG TPA: YciI-like protein [Candidatus Limnocylindria bacterium]|nr:YciI-like protein [Candidatus Limnocylindria bacterium]